MLAPLVALVALLLFPSPAGAAPVWVWPLPGPHVVSRPFGLGATQYAAGHRGADLPGTPGEPVLAAGAGSVSYAGLLAGRGVVVIVHGALRTTYEPVSAVVRVGGTVGAGQQIGTLQPGHEGCPVAACLHWGLLRGQTYLDPVALVDPGPVRLLPRDGSLPPPAAMGNGPPDPAALPTPATLPHPAALPDEQQQPTGPGGTAAAPAPAAFMTAGSAPSATAAPGRRTALLGGGAALGVLVCRGGLATRRRRR